MLLPIGPLPSMALLHFGHPAVVVLPIKQKRKGLYYQKKNTHKEIE